jgi:ATP-dependent Lon protease
VHRVLKTPDGTMRLLVQGLERIRLLEYTQEQPFLRARIEIVPEVWRMGIEMEALMRAVQELFRKLIELEPQMPDELAIMSINVTTAPACLSGGQQHAAEGAPTPRHSWRWTACATSCCG